MLARFPERVFHEIRPEVVNHQAAQHSVAISTRDPQFDALVNVLGLLNVLTYCTRVGTSKIIAATCGASYSASDLLQLQHGCLWRSLNRSEMLLTLSQPFHYTEQAWSLLHSRYDQGAPPGKAAHVV
jgi:UDP-glucose 4-epimerase